MTEFDPHKDDAPITSPLADDPDLAELVEEFVGRLSERVASLEAALATRDVAALRTLSHQLKGAAGGYGFPTISESASTLEDKAAANASIEELTQASRELADLCARATAKPNGSIP